jgi:hypothetical protein
VVPAPLPPVPVLSQPPWRSNPPPDTLYCGVYRSELNPLIRGTAHRLHSSKVDAGALQSFSHYSVPSHTNARFHQKR